MAFEKCKRCGFMHYSTDPCKSSAERASPNQRGSQVDQSVEQRDASRGGPSPVCVGSTPILPVDTHSKAKFDKVAYMREYMRTVYRPKLKAKKSNRLESNA